MIVDKLNEIYEPLYHRAMNVYNLMKIKNFPVEWGWYAFHVDKINYEYVAEFFPVPVISIKDICDIRIKLNKIIVETGLSRDEALSFDFGIIPFEFEVYDEEFNCFYNGQTDMKDIKNHILNSDGSEINIVFLFDENVKREVILESVELCKDKGMHILRE